MAVDRPAPKWLAPAALLLAVVAIALSAWSLLSKDSSSSASGTTLPGDPKQRVCTAFDTVAKAVQLQTNNNLGQDPIAQAAVAGNARLALLGGGQYLVNSVDSEVDSELAEAARKFGNTLQDIGANALANVPNSDPQQTARLREGDATRQQIVELCK
ncbi:hypothetical protein JRC04_19085 [Mycolicibacterium sp. S2-37]|nr:hypothetical protein [Mycolicibacterium sp. S2-37]